MPSNLSKIPPQIVKVVAIDLNTGDEYELKSLGNSCYEFGRLGGVYNAYEVRLRFDWSDIDPNGDPTLDCDFYPPGSTKPVKSMKKHPAHQTKKEFDAASGMTLYEYNYSAIAFRFVLETTNIQTITGTARIVKPSDDQSPKSHSD
jgi:hypothetical protein